jgi:hypothetical protein
VIEDDHAVTDRSTSVSRWGVEEDGRAALAKAMDDAAHLSRPTGSSADVGSSRKTTAGSPSRATAQAEPLLHALGVAADAIAATLADARCVQRGIDLRSPGGTRQAGQPAMGSEHPRPL